MYLADSPLSFTSYDEFLHWRTASDILHTHHLYSENPMLPVSPLFPGLEIVSSALSSLSGCSTFLAGVILVGVAHVLMMVCLFLFFTNLLNSHRLAGIAGLLYIANPHFLFFDSQFSYETLALALMMFVLYLLSQHESTQSERWKITLLACGVLFAITLTHHMTGYVLDFLLILWALLSHRLGHARETQRHLAIIAGFAVVLSLLSVLIIRGPLLSYISSYFGTSFKELIRMLTGKRVARQLFVVYNGQVTPFWGRAVMLASVGLISLGLPFGWLCLWQRYRRRASICMLGLVSLFYPLSHLFRFTSSGSEIADRSAAFLFIAVACVLTMCIGQFWCTRPLSNLQQLLLVVVLSVIFLGGTMLGAGSPWQLLPGPYIVVADRHSIEPQGIQTALWASSWLGPDHRVATDRINRMLMMTYGQQRVVTSLADQVDISPVFFDNQPGPTDLALLRQAHVRYLVVDMRLSTGLPAIGIYFEDGEPASMRHTRPISVIALAKFQFIPGIQRIYDSGDIVIYDIGGVNHA
jgi:hypothetical protein